MDIIPLSIHSSLMNCFNEVIFLRFYDKFHISSRDGKMLGLSPGIKVSISSKSGHSTFVLSAIYFIKSITKETWNSSCTSYILGLCGKSIQVALLSERSRAMLPACVVSFNSTIPRAQSIISYGGFTFTTAYNYKNLAIANRSRVSCAHNMSRASMVTP